MPPSCRFTSYVWLIVFGFKPLVVGTMITHDLLERSVGAGGASAPQVSAQEAHQWTRFDERGQPGVGYDYDDEVAA